MKKLFINKIKPLFGVIRPWVIISLMVAVLFIFVSFAEKSSKEFICKGIKVCFNQIDKNKFLTENDIVNIINDAAGGFVVNKRFSDINLDKIEDQLDKNPFVKKSEVYSKLNDTLYVNISYKNPVLRIMSITGEDYYLDEDGQHMSLSANHTARVLIANGYITDSPDFIADKCLFEMAQIIIKDTFLRSLIGQIYVAEHREKNYISKEFLLIPRIGDLNIEFGNAEDMEMKFKELKIFYKNIYPVIDREKYETVNVNFNNQIILK